MAENGESGGRRDDQMPKQASSSSEVDPLASEFLQAPTAFQAPVGASEASRAQTVPRSPAAVGAAGVPPAERVTMRRHYDRDALRRGVAQAFSSGELSRFAKQFRVFTDRDGTAARGAAQLVRALDARDELAQLDDALRQQRPDFDWPEPTLEPVSQPVAAPAEEAVNDPYAPTGAAAASMPQVSASRAPTAQAPTAQASAVAGSSATPAIDSRRLTMIAALVFGGGLALGIGATLFATLRGTDATESNGHRGPAAIAMLAAQELGSSVDYLTEACEVEERLPKPRARLAEAFRSCAVTEIPAAARNGSVPRPIPTARPKVRRPQPERSIPLRRTTPAAACLDKCHTVHQQCMKTECGAEPSSANQFPDWQRCTARCMARYSRCRLACR